MADKIAYIGIDCGKGGAIACLSPEGRVISEHTPVTTTRKKKRAKSKDGKTRYSTKTEYDKEGMLEVLRSYTAKHNFVQVLIEAQRQRPGDSKQVVFQVAYGQALWEMACVALGLPYEFVLPSQWKPCYLPPKAEKKESLELCRKLYPGQSLPLVKDEARAEATLIADYGKRLAEKQPFLRTKEPRTRKKK